MRSAAMTYASSRDVPVVGERTLVLRDLCWAARLTVLSCLIVGVAVPHARAQSDNRKTECLAAYGEAQEERLQGALLAAREQLMMCSRDDCPKPIIRDCSEWLTEVERDLSSVIFSVRDEAGRDLPAAQVRVNGKLLADHAEGRAQLFDPGPYTYRVEMPGFAHVESTIVMRQSEKNRIVLVKLAKPIYPVAASRPGVDTGFRVPTASIVLGATAVVAVAGFAYFGVSGQNKRDDAERCSVPCGELIESGKRDYVVANISLGVAVAAAGSALLFLLLDHDHPPPTAAARAQLRPRFGPASVRWDVRF
jgi:hypothetical protein